MRRPPSRFSVARQSVSPTRLRREGEFRSEVIVVSDNFGLHAVKAAVPRWSQLPISQPVDPISPPSKRLSTITRYTAHQAVRLSRQACQLLHIAPTVCPRGSASIQLGCYRKSLWWRRRLRSRVLNRLLVCYRETAYRETPQHLRDDQSPACLIRAAEVPLGLPSPNDHVWIYIRTKIICQAS